MNKKSERIKNQLRGSEDKESSKIDFEFEDGFETENPPRKRFSRNFIGIMIIAVMLYFIVNDTNLNSWNPFAQTSFISSGPSEDLLNRMGARMVEMGYTGLDHDDLRALRRDGVTATYISNLRAIGFSDLTLDEAVSLAKADANTTFISMMIELGYDLTVEEIVMLKDANVKAHYTSNVHDLGYRDVTLDQLVRMNRIGVSIALIKELQAERGEDVPLEDIIRYRISNQ